MGDSGKGRMGSGGRLAETMDGLAARLNASVGFDKRLASVDILGSLAHARMLGRVGVLSPEEVAAIEGGFETIVGEIESGAFAWSAALEDVHMNLEARLTELVGDAGKRLHTARSRNDQVATDLRLWIAGAAGATVDAIGDVQRALVGAARRGLDVIMPGYTHLQRAQPIRAAHHLLAYVEMLRRDGDRMAAAAARALEECPLGSAALAGTSFPIDRDGVAAELGFERPSANSLDAVASRDFALEYLACAAILMGNLSRLGEELVLWASAEFGFIDLPEAFVTGSSIMPQKRNPDIAELVRAKSGRVTGALMTLLMVVKGLPLAYNKDLQEDKEPVFDAADTLALCLGAMAGLMAGANFRAEACAEAAAGGHTTATEVADHLVRRGVPFREAHTVVGRLVRDAEAEGLRLWEIPEDRLASYHPELDASVAEVLSPEGAVDRHDSAGGPARPRVLAEIERWEHRLGVDG
jgi:argininosuccinate lyase